MFKFKRLGAVCLVIICMIMLFGCGSENVGQTDESEITASAIADTEKIDNTTEASVSNTESTEGSEELIMPMDNSGNAVEIITMPNTESAEKDTASEPQVMATEAKSEATTEPADKTQPQTIIELPFIPAD